MRISQEAITPDIDIAFATRFVELEVEAAEEGREDGVEFCAGESGRGGGFSGGIHGGGWEGGMGGMGRECSNRKCVKYEKETYCMPGHIRVPLENGTK